MSIDLYVHIPFLDEFKYRMRNGKKTCTSRNKKYGGVGDWFGAFGKAFVITAIERKDLSDVAWDDYAAEGFKTPHEFIECWAKLHPRAGWTPNKRVYVYSFRGMGEEIK